MPHGCWTKLGAHLLGIVGEYNFYPCGLGAYFWKFTGLDAMNFKDFVATGATDEEVDHWVVLPDHDGDEVQMHGASLGTAGNVPSHLGRVGNRAPGARRSLDIVLTMTMLIGQVR